MMRSSATSHLHHVRYVKGGHENTTEHHWTGRCAIKSKIYIQIKVYYNSFCLYACLPVLYHIFKTIPSEWTWNFVVPRLCWKSKLVYLIFFADRQKFILSCVMQATLNKSLKANIVYCVQYLEKGAKVLKFVLTTWCRDIKHDHYTIDRDLHGINGHSPDV